MFVFCFVSPHTCLFLGRANGRLSGSRESHCPAYLGFAEGICLDPRCSCRRLVQTPALMPPTWDCSSLAWRRAASTLHTGEVMDGCSLPNGQIPTGSKGQRVPFPFLPLGREPSRKSFGEWDFHPCGQDHADAENRAAGAEVLAPVPLPCELV